jgi:hypothetical protein
MKITAREINLLIEVPDILQNKKALAQIIG